MTAPISIAAAALVRDGRVLLGHRHPSRRAYPDCWDLVGGHVETGGHRPAAVVRECREELGVEVDDPQPFPISVDDHALECTRSSSPAGAATSSTPPPTSTTTCAGSGPTSSRS